MTLATIIFLFFLFNFLRFELKVYKYLSKFYYFCTELKHSYLIPIRRSTFYISTCFRDLLRIPNILTPIAF